MLHNFVFKKITKICPASTTLTCHGKSAGYFVPFQFCTVDVSSRDVSSHWMFRPTYMFIQVILKYDNSFYFHHSLYENEYLTNKIAVKVDRTFGLIRKPLAK